mgnify:CR=1 FL=1
MENRKSVCFVVSSPMTAETFLRNHFEVLKDHFDIFLIANFPLDYNFDQVKLKREKVIHLEILRNINFYNDFKAILKLNSIIKEYKFDIVHSITPKAGFVASLSGFISKSPIRIHTFTGQIWATKSGLYRLLLKYIDKLISTLVTHVLVDGESQLLFLIKHNIVNLKKAKVLGKGSISGVDLEKFKPNRLVRNSLREKFDISSSSIVFIYMGRLKRDKGVLDLAKAFMNLSKEFSSKELALFFIGPDEENIKCLIEASSKNVSINFIDYTSTPEQYLQLGDVFCLPSYREGFGTSVIEASALELPVICSDIYGLRDAFIDKKTGLSFRVNDIEDLKNKMSYLVENPKKIKQFGENGGIFVKENFSASFVSNCLLNFYLDL